MLANSKLNSIEVLISKALIDEFVLINNMFKKLHDMKEEIKNSNDKWKFKIFMKNVILLFKMWKKIQKVKINGKEKRKYNAFIEMCIAW